jgi:hypothetical protein
MGDEIERLQHLCDDQADKLRRIRELETHYPKNRDNDHIAIFDLIKSIATAPLGPDWRGMCEKAKPIMAKMAKGCCANSDCDAFPCIADKCLKEYKEVTK